MTVARRQAAVIAALAFTLAAALGACTSGDSGDAAGPTSPDSTTDATTTTLALADRPPETLAAELAAIEVAIRDPATPSSDLRRLGEAQQQIYRALAGDHYLAASAIAALPAELAGVAEANVAAGASLTPLSDPAPRELPAWRIVEPPPAEELLGLYRAAEAETGAPWEYLAAIHFVETRMSRIQGDSFAGAQGPMQFIPTTWDIYGQGGDITDNADAIAAAGRLLADRGAPEQMDRALFAYNPSERYVEAVTNYAELMAADERAYYGYYHWQVYYFDTLLPVGYGA